MRYHTPGDQSIVVQEQGHTQHVPIVERKKLPYGEETVQDKLVTQSITWRCSVNKDLINYGLQFAMLVVCMEDFMASRDLFR